MLVLCNKKHGNNFLVATELAKHFDCPVVAAEDNPDISEADTIALVVPNTGDEELPEAMEEYLVNLSVRNKRYLVCELGNYFGFQNYCGCKKIVFRILDQLGWTRLSDVSLDSLPKVDWESFGQWVESLKEKFLLIER